MNLTPWKSTSCVPFFRSRSADPIREFQREMNDLMSTFFTRGDMGMNSIMDADIYPAVDLKEKDNKYLLDADMPGINESDIDIDFKNNTLILKGEKRSEKESKDEDYVCVERSYGSFRREIPFSEEIDQDSIKAELKDGVLHIELSKKEKGKTSHKKIPIKH